MFGIPLEYLMFGGIGFCLAWLTALMVMPAVHNRATRLARERYDDLPVSMQEIRAEKDTIRAGFAAATRDLELKIEKLKDRTVAHATDLARRNQLIERLKQEVETLTKALRDSEGREQAARDELREARRGFADKDVTLGAIEGEITLLQRDRASKEAALQAAERELASLRDELAARDMALRGLQHENAALRNDLSTKDAAVAVAQQEVAAGREALRASKARESEAREALHAMRRGGADRSAARGSADADIAAMARDLAARDAALHAAEQDRNTLRIELAAKDIALKRAETEIAAIKAEIAALTPLLQQKATDNVPTRRVEVVPFVAPARQIGHGHANRDTAQSPPARIAPQALPPQPAIPLQPAPAQPIPASVARAAARNESLPRSEPAPGATRAPLDVIPAPTRLIPPTIPPAQQQHDDSIRRAWTEIHDAARRVDDRKDGPNQRLRAAYAPLAKSTP